MSNEAQRLYRSLNELTQGHADQLLKYAWERDQAIAQRDALLSAAKAAKLTIDNMHDLFGANPAGEWMQKLKMYSDLCAAIAAAESKEEKEA